MNQQQIMTTVGTVLTIFGIIATSTGVMDQTAWTGLSQQLTTVIGGILSVVGIVTTAWQQRQTAQVKAAASIGGDGKGVQVHVDLRNPDVPVSVKALARNGTSDVVPMGTGGPVLK